MEDWQPPGPDLPEIPAGSLVALDTETHDPRLTDRGPGWAFDDGYIVGVSLAWGIDKIQGVRYYPLRHLAGNWQGDIGKFMRWLRAQLRREDLEWTFANSGYDLGWLKVIPEGRIHDIQVAAPLLNEHRYSYSLDNLAKDELGEGKDETLLKRWAQEAGIKPKLVKSMMALLPSFVVGPYAEQDAVATWRVHKAYMPRIAEQGLTKVYRLEMDLVPMLMEMRKIGVKVNVDKAQELRELLLREEDAAAAELQRVTGIAMTAWDLPTQMLALRNEGVTNFPQTAKKKKDGLTAPYLEEIAKHQNKAGDIAKMILELRRKNRQRVTFVERLVLESHYKGRIHAQFNALKSDDGGTVSGRFSCVAAWTPVTTPRGEVPIVDIKVGDQVWTHMGRWRPVTKVWIKGVEQMYDVHLSNGQVITCTGQHEFLTFNHGWRTLNAIKQMVDFATGEHSPCSIEIQGFGPPECRQDSERIKDTDSQCDGYPETQSGSGRISVSQEPSMVHSETGGEAPTLRSRSNTNQAKACRDSSGMRENIPTENGPTSWASEIAEPCGRPSYRRKFCERQIRQSVSVHSCGARENSLTRVFLCSISLAQCFQVWDIEVQEDHSYLAHGVFNHNSSDPNLQQVPAREEIAAGRIRGLFEAEEGEELASVDYASQEPRLAVHWAVKGGSRLAQKMAQEFIANPRLDLHQKVADLMGIKRSKAKILNLAQMYSQGGGSLCLALGLDASPDSFVNEQGKEIEYLAPGREGRRLLDEYNRLMPFMKATAKGAEREARENGYITTIEGRRCRVFHYAGGGDDARKAFNRRIQGSAADMIKRSMLEAWRAGYRIRMTVHDENVFSVTGKKEALKCVEIMNNAVELVVPVVCDLAIGKTWGSMKELAT